MIDSLFVNKPNCTCNMLQTGKSFTSSESVAVIDKAQASLVPMCKTSLVLASLHGCQKFAFTVPFKNSKFKKNN